MAINPEKARYDALKAFEKERDKPANLGSDVHYGLQAHFDKDVVINSSNLHILSAAETISFGNSIEYSFLSQSSLLPSNKMFFKLTHNSKASGSI